MRVLRLNDFEKMAREVVDDHFQLKVPLEDRLVKAAQDGGLNPDQIQNLVQLANTLAHLTLFDQKSGGDKIIDFEPVDPSNVLKKVYQGGCPAAEVSMTKEEPSQNDRIQDFFGDLPGLTDKIKEVFSPEEASSPEESGGSVTIIKIKKVAEELDNRKTELAYEFKEELEKMATCFSKLYAPSFEEFEKAASRLHGEKAYPILSELRRCLRKPLMKTASVDILRDRGNFVIDSETREMRSLEKLLKLADEYSDHETACEALRAKLGVRA